MNETMKSLLERRSVRTYADTAVAEDAVKQILEAALFAPSSMGKQARFFAVFEGLEAIRKFEVEVKEATKNQPPHRYTDRILNDGYSINYGAPLFIVCMADPTVTSSPEADCACSLQNMMLAAHSLGLGSCWINQLNYLHEEPGFLSYMASLGIPANFAIYGCVTIGHPKGNAPKAAPRKDQSVVVIKN